MRCKNLFGLGVLVVGCSGAQFEAGGDVGMGSGGPLGGSGTSVGWGGSEPQASGGKANRVGGAASLLGGTASLLGGTASSLGGTASGGELGAGGSLVEPSLGGSTTGTGGSAPGGSSAGGAPSGGSGAGGGFSGGSGAGGGAGATGGSPGGGTGSNASGGYGSGGMGGTYPSGGMGAGGSGGSSSGNCAALWSTYQTALDQARVCVKGQSDCGSKSLKDICGCDVSVETDNNSHTDDALAAYNAWLNAQCQSGGVTCLACVPITGTCVTQANGARCQ